jgi:hypothetical protein
MIFVRRWRLLPTGNVGSLATSLRDSDGFDHRAASAAAL